MKVLCTGTNIWGVIPIYLSANLKELQRPTPFATNDIHGRTIYSKMFGEDYPEPKMIELKKGDYVMMISEDDIRRDGDMACGHNHYFDGVKLISVYTKQEYKIELPKKVYIPSWIKFKN